ncbi:hypothetical protein POPTR_019G077166v4 [Populus trichocarpa]|uniref:Uncharacterized protein n=1 Tax=Populus trichocarpa TaxID=3694 RepID=A0A3N7GBZ0_POPTR|nr:hypothetical protein BDE02_19G073400 [Populus trichocarpa]RQP03576.1 hypothetical protein POPTR_019G077166v4 [Populus trichocarpa]
MLELHAISFLHHITSMMYLMMIIPTQPEVRLVTSRYNIENISELEIFIAMHKLLYSTDFLVSNNICIVITVLLFFISKRLQCELSINLLLHGLWWSSVNLL